MPMALRKRGRPKGAEMTVIGLPKKRKMSRPVKFLAQLPREREEVMLGWFVTKDTANAAINNGKLIQPEDVEKKITTAACVDEVVNLEEIKRYFTPKGWENVQKIKNCIVNSGEFFCKVCLVTLGSGRFVILCDCCLQWSHFDCLGLRKPPKAKVWFCCDCKKDKI